MKIKPSILNLTVICVAGNKHGESIASLYRAKKEIDAARFVLLTNIDITASGIECINVGGLDSWVEYNRFIIKELYKHFQTDYCLLVQWDGVVLDGELWSEDFIKFDYIGASWLNGECGNGGFSARSKRLMEIVAKDDFIQITDPEDNCLCILYKKYLQEKYDVTYAPKDVCDRFSFELNEPLQPTFGKHAFHWPDYQKTVVFKRSHALGDVLSIEPVMHHFHKKGYQIALETTPYFMDFFRQHYFPVVPREHLNPKLPVIEIDLNKSYEVKPQQLHLESYYDFAQVPKEERIYRNTQLALSFDPKATQNKLFPKYAVIHYDHRSEQHRNIHGLDWDIICIYLKNNGYTVIQVGAGERELIKQAIQMNTPTALFLMWVVGGADLFIGCDSGVSHIASGFDVPSVIFSGSVDLRIIHPDLTNKLWINRHGDKVCNKPLCWHTEVASETGAKCYIDNEKPPCVQFDTHLVIDKIDKFLKEKDEKNRVDK